jgi:hypothetical protein
LEICLLRGNDLLDEKVLNDRGGRGGGRPLHFRFIDDCSLLIGNQFLIAKN